MKTTIAALMLITLCGCETTTRIPIASGNVLCIGLFTRCQIGGSTNVLSATGGGTPSTSLTGVPIP